jgi:hypothetical protein
MAQAIQMISEKEFKLVARGCDMTLNLEPDGRWVMFTINAAVRAWGRGYPIPKYFDTLKQVEEKYKTWRGIASLAAACNGQNNLQ